MQFVRAGAAFLLVDRRFNGAPHLWVILNDSDPTFSDGKVVGVSLVTARPHTDPTTTLQVGDHPFVRHPTHIDYGGARLMRVETLEHELGVGRCHCEPDVPRRLLIRIQAGLIASPRTANFMRALCAPIF